MLCFLKCVSKAIDVTVDELERRLNYIGREIISKDNPPYCYRGYTPYLVSQLLLQYGYCLCPFPTVVIEANKCGVFKETELDLEHMIHIHPNLKIIDCSDAHAVLRFTGETYNPSNYPEPTKQTRTAIFIVARLD